jgi:hypothetical protein
LPTVLEGSPRPSIRVLAHPLSSSHAPSRRAPWLALGLFAISTGLAAVALLGPLATGLIDYRVTETLRNQTIGLDLASLFVVAPLALLAGVLSLRRHIAGSVLALGIGAYTSYMFLQYILGPDYADLAGNNERLFPLTLILFAVGWGVALTAWNELDVQRLSRSSRRERLLGRIVLPVLALAAFSRYVPQLMDWMSSSPKDENYLAGPSFSWAIAMLDLGVFLPATVATCVGLVRGAAWSQKSLFAVVGWFGLVGPAVAAMAITMYVNDDPIASGGNAVLMTVLGAAFVGLALFVYWPLVRAGHPSTPERRVDAKLTGARRWVIAAVTGVVGAGAVFGGWGLLSNADGLGAKSDWLDGSPFPDYRIPGLVLLIVGGGMLLTTLLALRRSRFAGVAALTMGVVLLIWGAVETVTIGYQGADQIALLAGWVVGPALPLLKLGWDATNPVLRPRAAGR